MADMDRKDIEERLWKALEDERTGMLGLTGPDADHMQPMTGFCERGPGAIWFFLRRDNHLIQSLSQGAKAMYCLNTKDHEVWACIAGSLYEQHDQERIDKYWNPVVAAWFPEGKDDPELTLLRLDLDDAQVWVSRKGPIRFALEIAKANLTKSEPDLGDQARLNLH